jgi:hypothetical protein
MRYRWRGPQPAEDEEQIANAPDGLFPLAPVSETPAENTRSNWSAVMPGQPIPMAGEDRYAYPPYEE